MDSYTTKVDGVDDVLAAHVNNLQDAMVATETTLGASGNVGLCEGRLTLATATPVTTADQTAKTTIYWTPFRGNRVSIYDGSSGWDTYEFSEISVAVPGTTTTPFDVFVYNSGGSATLSTTNWTNDTTRATALTTQDGVYVKSGATGYRYLGTGRTTGSSGQTEDSLANRFLWNYYNRVLRRQYRTYTNAHTYNTAAWRAFDNAASSVQATFVVGVLEESVAVNMMASTTWAAGNSILSVSVGLNTTSASSVSAPILNHAAIASLVAVGSVYPAVGYNYLCPIEYTDASGTAPTFTSTYLYATTVM